MTETLTILPDFKLRKGSNYDKVLGNTNMWPNFTKVNIISVIIILMLEKDTLCLGEIRHFLWKHYIPLNIKLWLTLMLTVITLDWLKIITD